MMKGKLKRASLFFVALLLTILIPIQSYTTPDTSRVNTNTLILRKLPTKTGDTFVKEGAYYYLFRVSEAEEKYKKSTLGTSDFVKLYNRLSTLTVDQLKDRYSDGQIVGPTDKNGEVIIENLPYGRYFIVEVVEQDGDFVINEKNRSTKLLDFYANNLEEHSTSMKSFIPKRKPPTPGDKPPEEPPEDEPPEDEPPSHYGERFYKQDGITGKGLFGAEFVLYYKEDDGYKIFKKPDGMDYVVTSDFFHGGYFEFTNLPLGDYMIEEINTPMGYPNARGTRLEFTVTPTSYNDGFAPIVKNNKPPEGEPPGGRTKVPGGGTIYTPGRTPSSYPTTYTSYPPGSSKPGFTGSMPRTGDIQIYLYMAAGAGIALAGYMLYRTDKKEEGA